jgi:hypothetical protein
MLFLSYAEEDGVRVGDIADWFRRNDIPFYLWEAPQERGVRFIDQMERQLNAADPFIAIDSPHFTASPWCHRETELAILREVRMERSQPGARFIRVLRIAATPQRDVRFLDGYDTFDASGPGTLDDQLGKLVASLGPAVSAQSGPAAARSAAPSPPSFRNRAEELDSVLRGITNSAGPHFWLVIAPPQLGKTWFMDQLALRLREEPGNWSARRVNVRDYPDDVRADIPWLLGQLFMLEGPSVGADAEALERIATEILGRRRPHLGMLDSAELLSADTVLGLQAAVSEIYRLVLEGDDRNVRIAFVAASRRDDEWRRVTRRPRLSLLPLSEFKPFIVMAALSDLAVQMGRTPGHAQLEAHAAHVYQVSEGLPALLAECLQWIQRKQWVGMKLLARQDQFEELAKNYINEGLLSSANLFRTGQPPDEKTRLAVESAFRGLAPYRLFTQAHLRAHVAGDGWLSATLTELEWSVEDLWGAISSTALLTRPTDEPWLEVQGAIRRLIFRYFYRSDPHRAAAHARARRFAGVWSDGLIGNDQVTGLVECLWHEAAELRYKQASDMAELLRESATLLVELLKSSEAYTGPELRRSAAQRMRNNDEFQDTLAHAPGLLDELVRIVDAPEGGRGEPR